MFFFLLQQGQNINDGFVKRSSVQFVDTEDAPPKPERFKTRGSVRTTELEDMSVNELEVF